VEGHIAEAPSPRRIPGYPYRSLFVVAACGKYYDELTRAEHAEVNHREKALTRLFASAVLPAAAAAAGGAQS
jgi:inosine/xanthosine triphosphate pyrophosphatase family protein